jgi:hypothetical protein
MSEDDADADDSDEVDDKTFEKYCPVLDFSSMDCSEFVTIPTMTEAQVKAANTTPPALPTDGFAVLGTKANMDNDDDSCEMMGGVKPTKPTNPKRQYTIEEAFKRKNTIEASRRTKAKSSNKYLFVHSTLHCMRTCSASGSLRIVVGDDNYFKACLGVKWFDTEFYLHMMLT